MNRVKILFIITILTTALTLCYSTPEGVHRLYSEGGDSLELLIVGKSLFLTDTLVLNYIKEKDIYYHCKVFNAKPANWELSKKEYTISLVKEGDLVTKVFFTVKTYLHDDEPVNTFTKRYYLKPLKKSIKTLKLTLVEQLKSSESYKGKGGMMSDLLDERDSAPFKEVEIIDYNDGTIWFKDPAWPDFSFHLTQNYSNRNNYSGTSQFGSCNHDYCYVNLELSGSTVTIYYQESGDTGSRSFAAKYKVSRTTVVKGTEINSKLEKL